MKKKIAFSVLGVIALSAMLYAQSAGELYQQGLVQENGVGNLQSAIELYKRAARAANGDRKLAADALLGAARCYEKLGQTESRKLYDEIEKSYPDQREQAALAHERLAAGQPGKYLIAPDLSNQEILAKLMDELKAAQLKRADLISKYAPQHPALMDLTAQIGALSRALQLESEKQGMDFVFPGTFMKRWLGPDQAVRFTGVIKDIQWINPNVLVTIEVQEAGRVTRYLVKGTNPRALADTGVTSDALKSGDIVTVEGLSVALGGSGANAATVGLATLTTLDGRKFYVGNSNIP